MIGPDEVNIPFVMRAKLFQKGNSKLIRLPRQSLKYQTLRVVAAAAAGGASVPYLKEDKLE